MADSTALRQRRHARHKRGDHSICRVGRCAAAGEIKTADVRQLASAVERKFVATRCGWRRLAGWWRWRRGRVRPPCPRSSR
jgi:hypothetical protein